MSKSLPSSAQFSLGTAQIQAALDYIERHREEVVKDYQRILDRHANYQYPPEVQAKLAQVRGVVSKKMDALRAQRQKKSGNAHPAGS